MTDPGAVGAALAARTRAAALARGTALGVTAEALVLPAGIITAAYLTRSLGPELYGRLSLVYAIAGPVSWIAATVFAGRAAVKLVSEADDWRAMAALLLRANFALAAGTAALFALLAQPMAAAFGDPGLVPYFWIASAEILLMPLVRLHRDVLIAQGKLDWPAAVTVAYHVSRLGLIVAAVAAGFGLAGVIVANAGARLLELIVCRLRVNVPLSGTPERGLASFRAVLGALFAYALSVQLFNRLDIAMLGVLDIPTASLGHYGAAQNLAIAPALVGMVFSPMLISALRAAEVRGEGGNVEALRRDSATAALALWALIAPVAAGAQGITVLLFGSSFAPAGPIFALLGLGAGGALLLSVLSAHEVAVGQYRHPVYAALPMLTLALILHLLLIPRWGAIGAATATAAAATSAGLGATLFGGRRRFAFLAGALFRAVVAGGAGALITHGLSRAGTPPLLDVLGGVIVTGGTLLALGIPGFAALRSFARSLFPLRSTPEL